MRLVDGNDLINVFGMKPGAKMGALLEEIKEAQAAGELTRPGSGTGVCAGNIYPI